MRFDIKYHNNTHQNTRQNLFYGTGNRKKTNATCLSIFLLPYPWYDVTKMCTCTREYWFDFLTAFPTSAPPTYIPFQNLWTEGFRLVPPMIMYAMRNPAIRTFTDRRKSGFQGCASRRFTCVVPVESPRSTDSGMVYMLGCTGWELGQKIRANFSSAYVLSHP